MGYRYIGSKARIADQIIDYIGYPEGKSDRLIDSFSGTGIVASKAADRGWNVVINDIMRYAVTMSISRLLSTIDAPFTSLGGYEQAIQHLNSLQPQSGFIWKEYSPASFYSCGVERRYFTEENAKKIDAVSYAVHQWKADGVININEFALLMTGIISATNDVANIAGTYGCFLSKWMTQALNTFELKCLNLRPNKVNFVAYNQDVFSISSNITDIVYLDPPYTKRQYASYYHILETLVCGDSPVVEGTSGLRPWRSKSSVFCYKAKALDAIVRLVIKQNAHRVILSYSNEGHVGLDELIQSLEPYGIVKLVEIGSISRYMPNQSAVMKNKAVQEYLIDFKRQDS